MVVATLGTCTSDFYCGYDILLSTGTIVSTYTYCVGTCEANISGVCESTACVGCSGVISQTGVAPDWPSINEIYAIAPGPPTASFTIPYSYNIDSVTSAICRSSIGVSYSYSGTGDYTSAMNSFSYTTVAPLEITVSVGV